MSDLQPVAQTDPKSMSLLTDNKPGQRSVVDADSVLRPHLNILELGFGYDSQAVKVNSVPENMRQVPIHKDDWYGLGSPRVLTIDNASVKADHAFKLTVGIGAGCLSTDLILAVASGKIYM